MPISEETRRKMSIAKIGRRGNATGHKFTEEQIARSSTGHLGQIAWNKGLKLSEEHRANLRKKHKKMSVQSRLNISIGHRGSKTHLWRGGVSARNRREREQLMSTFAYKIWRESVFTRDDHRCYDCGERGGKLHADHIYPYAQYPRLRLSQENGITRCISCHSNRHRLDTGKKIVVS